MNQWTGLRDTISGVTASSSPPGEDANCDICPPSKKEKATHRAEVMEDNVWELPPGRYRVCKPCIDEYNDKVAPHRASKGKDPELINLGPIN